MNELDAPVAAQTVVLPTGQVLDLADAQQAGQALVEIRQLRDRLEEIRQAAIEALWEEGARRGTKTVHLDGFDVELVGGERVEYDAEKLRDRLTEVGCPIERIEQLIKTVVTYKVDGNVARWTAGANPEYAAAIAACRETVPIARSARVKR